MNPPKELKPVLQNLPDKPGVYLMKNSAGAIIYVGKAVSLKKRVPSYFQKKDHDAKTRILVKNISDLEYIITDTEIEALILESSLIKKHRPKYNVRLKDDKRYPSISVTIEEEYPRVILTRKITNSSNRYFGPYTDARAARNIVSMINNVFGLKRCTKKLPPGEHSRPCLDYQIGRCGGPCTGAISRDEYMILIESAVKFLEGAIDPVIAELTKLMKKYSAELRYEKAARMRDAVADIRKIFESQKVSSPVGMDQDYAALSVSGDEAILLLFEFRKGSLTGRKIFIYENAAYSGLNEIISVFLMDYYEKAEIPQRIVVQIRIRDAGSIERYLTGKTSKKVSLSLPVNPSDRSMMGMIMKNIAVIAADRNARKNYLDPDLGLAGIRDLLGLEKIPETIECFDISNIQGGYAVASMVFFRNGLPEKKQYRRYKIRGYDAPNDPGMIHEAVARRVQHLANENLPFPDLILIDGGIPQLSRAREAAGNFTKDIRIISLAKRNEEIYYDIQKRPLSPDKNSPALHLLQQVRDEAHRFAVTYHRKLRSMELSSSVLDRIPGVGKKTKKLILTKIQSVEKLKKMDSAAIASIPGIGRKTAEKIAAFFKANPK